MKKSKTGIAAAIVAIGALAIYGVAHSSKAAPGFHILNNGQAAYTTDPSGCPGYNFPAKVAPGTAPNAGNAVTSNSSQVQSPSCQTTYTSSSDSTQTCLVEVQTLNGNVMAIRGTSVGGGCKTSQAGTSVILGAS